MRLRRYIYLFAIGLFMLTSIAKSQTPTPNPIQSENELRGTTSWQIPCPGTNPSSCIGQGGAFNRQIEGYTSHTSVNVGETITFHVNVTDGSPTFKFEIYRMGWYGGAGGRLIDQHSGIPAKHQLLVESDPMTGLLEYNWTPPSGSANLYNWTVPATAVSGVYLVKLITEPAASGAPRYAVYTIFVVRDDARVRRSLSNFRYDLAGL